MNGGYIITAMKHCKHCGQDKEVAAFGRAKRGKNGLDWWCKACRTKVRAEYKAHPVGNGTGRKPRPVREGMRWCGGCKQELPVLHFTGTERTCKLCKQDRHCLRVYGITRRERDELVNRQGGTCAICKRRAPVYIDHCHKTNRVRSILCQQCNTAIGLFYEDVEIMQRAMEYVAAIARNE
jgi:hypothetical protein